MKKETKLDKAVKQALTNPFNPEKNYLEKFVKDNSVNGVIDTRKFFKAEVRRTEEQIEKYIHSRPIKVTAKNDDKVPSSVLTRLEDIYNYPPLVRLRLEHTDELRIEIYKIGTITPEREKQLDEKYSPLIRHALTEFFEKEKQTVQDEQTN